jgi:type IV pilus assembly protein PilV
MLAIAKKQRGAMMIEILITLAITVIGMYGIIEVQSRLQQSEMDSYQRTQALLLLRDISNRIETNRSDVPAYLTADFPGSGFVGVGQTCPVSDGTTASNDLSEWCNALQGASESLSTANVGAMIGGRGCVEEVITGSGLYMITVTWQGMSPIAAPPANVSCASGLYNNPVGSACVEDLCRRYVTTVVRVANL